MAEIQSREIRNPERIRRIIGILRLDGREIEIHIPQYIEVAKIAKTTPDFFTVKITDSFIDYHDENLESVFISFVFSGIELLGKCNIVKLSDNTLTLEYPQSLESRSRRRYPRVSLGRKISARLKLKQVPERKLGELSSRDLPVKYSKLYWEVQREGVDIKRVVLLVGAEVKKISPGAEILLFNRETILTRDAQILRKSGKTLFVDDCRKIQSYTRLIPSDKLISYSHYLNERRLEGISKEVIIEELKGIVREHLSQGYTSMAFVPIFFKDEVIGAIKAVSRGTEKLLTLEDVSDLMALSALLTMGFEKSGYTPDVGDVVQSDLLNISEGGLFLTIPGGENKVYIEEGTNIEVNIPFEEGVVTLKGRVLRKDEKTKGYAVELFGLDSSNRRMLKKFISKTLEKFKPSE